MFGLDLDIHPAWILLAAGMALAAIMIRRAFRRLGARARSSASLLPAERPVRPQFEWDGARREESNDFDSQEAELYELARIARGRLDAKILVLEQLIATSDRQIVRLQQLLSRLEEKSERV